MSLINQASLILTPNAVKESKLYSIVPSNGNGDMTVVRATTATRVNSARIIESVASNVSRLNYDVAGGCPSILVEPQRTNLLTYSEQINDASWGKSNLTVTADATISPNGTLNADRLIENTTLSQHAVTKGVTITSGQTVTYSVYLKINGRNSSNIFVFENTYTNGFGANFNLSNGAVTSNYSQGIGILSSSSITNIGNDWYRCTITGVIGTFTSLQAVIYLANGTVTSYLGDGTSGLFVWGAQVEQGAYATSYIPTVASTVTRNADVISRNNIYTNGLITGAGGTWFVEINNNLSLTRDAIGNGIWIGDNNTSSTVGNSLNIRHNGLTTRLIINKCVNGVLTPLYTTLTNTIKIAIDWNGTTADVFVNSVKVVAGTAFTTTNMEFLNSSGVDVQKYIKSMMLFPKPLTDAEMAQLTTL